MRIELVKNLVRETGQRALAYAGRFQSVLKADTSPVTEADLFIQEFLAHRLKSLFPPYKFMAEEKVNRFENIGYDDYVWVIDPIDGTDAFREGLPVWGVSVGLVHRFQPVLGVFYMPCSDTMFYRDENGTAYMNGKVITRPEGHISRTVYVTSGFHRHFEVGFKGKIRALGSTVAHLCYLALGAGQGAVIKGFPWDVIAGYAILEATGGRLFTLDQKPFDIEQMMRSGDKTPFIVASPHAGYPDFAYGLIPKS
ncbi:MAG: inositol monophosphatase [Candidatus Auribacterota bacterium]